METRNQRDARGQDGLNNRYFDRFCNALRALVSVLRRSTDKWNIILAAAGVISATIFYNQLSVMQAQLDEMKSTGKQTEEMIATNKSLAVAAEKAADVAKQTLIAAQRAWIRTDLIGFGGGGLAIDVNGASVSVSFKITNTGNSPAINVTPQAWLVVVKNGGPSPSQEQQRRCGEIRDQPFATAGFTLFPGESFPSNIGISNWSLGTNASREDIEKGALTSGDKKHVPLYVVGCIDYTFPTDAATHHQTGFIRQMGQDGPSLVSLEDGIIPIARLSLIETDTGTGRYAD